MNKESKQAGAMLNQEKAELNMSKIELACKND